MEGHNVTIVRWGEVPLEVRYFLTECKHPSEFRDFSTEECTVDITLRFATF